MLALIATWGQCRPADVTNDANFPVLDSCIDIRDPAGPTSNDVDDVRVGAIINPAGLPAGIYGLVEVKNVAGVYEAIPFFDQVWQGTQRVVGAQVNPPLTSAVRHMQIQPRGGNDLIDTRGVTSLIDIGEPEMVPNYSLVQRWLDNNDPSQYEISHDNEAVTIFAGDGEDTIHGSEFGDCIKGDEFNPIESDAYGGDVIYGYDGDDHIEGKNGSDLIYGGLGDDYIYGEIQDGGSTNPGGQINVDRNDTIYGEEGDDFISGQDADDILIGGMGNDTLFGAPGIDQLAGGSGDDWLGGGPDNDTYIYDGALTGDGPESTALGDRITESGTSAIDADDAIDFSYIFANGQQIGVTLHLVETDDSVSDGFDQIQQISPYLWLRIDDIGGAFLENPGIERVLGTPFDDFITGQDGANELFGGDGDDHLCGEGLVRTENPPGMPFLNIQIFDGCNDGSVETAGDNDILHGQAGDDRLQGGPANDTLFGGNDDDLLFGETGFDNLQGEDGYDFLDGGVGNDTLNGGNQDDILMGREGNDTLIGGNGWDIGRGGVGSDLIIAEDPDQEADTVKALPIDLTPASDTGVSSTDDITSDNTPTFDVIAVPGTFVELYRATSPGGAGQVVASMTFSQRGLSQLTDTTAPPDGVYYYYITVADSPTDPKSVRSDQLQVTIDTAGPRVTAVTIDGANTFDTAYSIPTGTGALQLKTVPVGGADQVILNFDEAVDVVVADLTLKGRNSSSTVTTFNLTGFIDQAGGAAPWKATWTSSAVFLTESDKYQQMHLTLASGAAGVIDVAGNPLDGFFANPTMLDSNPSQALPSGGGSGADDFTLSYTHLYGDADQTNAVDIGDLNAVRNNFGSTNATWAEGSFDGQGTVDIDELNYVRNNFGVSVTTAWDGSESLMGGGGGAGSSVVMASQESTTSPLIGEEAMRQALRELYSETIAVGKSSPYDGLFGWDLLGDEDWWNVTLGEDAKA